LGNETYLLARERLLLFARERVLLLRLLLDEAAKEKEDGARFWE
jgi:hypothetical protein